MAAVSRPRIGLTLDADEAGGRYQLGRAYADAVAEAGGLPLLLPHLPSLAGELLGALDGLVITGGAFDVPPSLYGEARRPACGPEKAERTQAELGLLSAALAAGVPVLGVCGGMQLLAVARGGALYQDLTADRAAGGAWPATLGSPAVGHEQPPPKDRPTHLVSVRPGTRLAALVGEAPLPVNSTHHQGVRVAGEGVVVSAVAPDGLVEALELVDHPFALGVQWHPEAAARHEPRHAAIYRGLVAACRRD